MLIQTLPETIRKKCYPVSKKAKCTVTEVWSVRLLHLKSQSDQSISHHQLMLSGATSQILSKIKIKTLRKKTRKHTHSSIPLSFTVPAPPVTLKAPELVIMKDCWKAGRQGQGFPPPNPALRGNHP